MPTTRGSAKAGGSTPRVAAAAKAKGGKTSAPKTAAPKSGKAEAAPKTVKEKLQRAKQNRDKLSPVSKENKENEVENNDTFRKKPLEAIFEPKEQVKLSEIMGKSVAPLREEKSELAELAFLGVKGTTPGGRRWRSRMKETNMAIQIAPTPEVIEEAEVA